MNDTSSPYGAPQSGMSPPPPEANPHVPTSIPKVFGIIHIVYACLGMIGAAFGVLGMVAMKAMAPHLGDEVEGLDGFFEAYEKMAVYTYIDSGLKVILGLVLLIAGIGLLKKKRWAQKLSVTWSVVRIVVGIGMTVFSYGVTLQFQQDIADFTQTNGDQVDQLGLQSSMQGVSSVMGVFVLSIYPVVSLILLSKKSVKDSLS